MRHKNQSLETRKHALSRSGLFDDEWYTARHGDVALSGLTGWDHFVKIGWDLGRNPGPGFDSKGYMLHYADVAMSGLDALSHYLFHGVAEGRSPNPAAESTSTRARVLTDVLRTRLNVVGQASGRVGLESIASGGKGDTAAFAGRDLALWYLGRWRRTGIQSDAESALQWATSAFNAARDEELRSRLFNVLLVAESGLGRPPPTDEELKTWKIEGRLSADAWLALAGFKATPEARLKRINETLTFHNLAPLVLRQGKRLSPYDRLDVKTRPEPVDGQLVTVLIAAYKAEATISTALRAMTQQSWRNLEILVIDDASPDRTADLAEAAAQLDPRIRVLRQPQNSGAYVARNTGLAAAKGEFVTIHDADDWCHPERIERQVAMMKASSSAVANTSEHVRVRSDLAVTRLSPEAHFVTENPASLLFRREPIVEALGCWDEVRVAADNEFIRRIIRVFGKSSLIREKTGPLALLRDWDGSSVNDGPLSIDGYAKGARLTYLDAQEYFHRTAPLESLHYKSGGRPFPAPGILRKKRRSSYELSLLIAADFRSHDHVVEMCLKLAKSVKGHVGLVPLIRPLAPDGLDLPLRLSSAVNAEIDGENLIVVCPGESARAPTMVIPDPETLSELPDPLPALQSDKVKILADHAPVTRLPVTGRNLTRYNPSICEASVQKLVSGSKVWMAYTPRIRAALINAGASKVSRQLFRADDPRSVLR